MLTKGYRDEARKSMQFVYKGNVEQEFEKMAENLDTLCCSHGRRDLVGVSTSTSMTASFDTNGTDDQDESDQAENSIWTLKFRNVMKIGLGLIVAQQASFQPCVVAYSRILFEAAEWNANTSVITVIIMGLVSSFTVSQVDNLGRKKLLMAGSSIMLVAVTFLAIGFWGWDENDNPNLSSLQKQLVLWGMFAFVSGYQVGFGPISWTVLSEIYPTEIRGSAMALSVEVNFFFKFLSHFMFPVIQDLLGWGQSFVFFFITIASGLIFVHFKVPETTGMTLEEIQEWLKIDDMESTTTAPEFQYANMESTDKSEDSNTDQNPITPIV